MDLEKQIAELNTKVSSLQDELKTSQSTINGNNLRIAELDKALLDSKAEVSTLKSQAETLTKELSEANKKNSDLSTELTTMKTEALKVSRVSKLVSGGLVKEEAEKKVNTFASLTNEQFDVVADALIAAVKSTREEEDIDVDPAEGNADANINNKDKNADPKLALESANEDKAKVVRSSIAGWLETEIGISKE